MIQEFVNTFMAKKPQIAAAFSEQHPGQYIDIVRTVVKALHEPGEIHTPDPERIHEIDDGDYMGTLVFVIAENGYAPEQYWHVRVAYGTCSACDTLEGIRQYDSGAPTPEQVDAYMTLALHIVQKIKLMSDDLV